ncbi:MAG: iron ABC transporter permease [Bacteroidales bacterium]|nr:iron ABC transporter permease [Bacteroidales bacterium]
MPRKFTGLWFLVLGLSVVALILLNLLLGSVSIPFSGVLDILMNPHDSTSPQIWQNIIWKSRWPQCLTALVAGAGLAVSGQMMQTVFHNPLAGPSVLGISSGASLGVAMVVLLSGSILGHALSSFGFAGELAVTLSAIIGSLAVMSVIVWVSSRVRGNVTLLIIGVMVGYIANAVIGVLKYFSVEEDIRSYVIWGLGSFARVSGGDLTILIVSMTLLLLLSLLTVKTLNLLLLGEIYARNLGLNVKQARMIVIGLSGCLVAVVTAYCGPIMFIGLAVPHLCRGIFRSGDHRVLMPANILCGALLALACNLIARLPGIEGALPVNSVTSLVGAPVVIYVLFSKRRETIPE